MKFLLSLLFLLLPLSAIAQSPSQIAMDFCAHNAVILHAIATARDKGVPFEKVMEQLSQGNDEESLKEFKPEIEKIYKEKKSPEMVGEAYFEKCFPKMTKLIQEKLNEKYRS